ncbi:copper transporter [Corynebacterium cystitidis]|uniref:Copper transport outer membrane protein, MctB n=1 Tax=Corynebacterium cystitidis DSM 20524 TaxID=1121357 RepID=A0A1H9PWW2_9CORY|nr:copper transporter [Corynebacterium cystitidis]WJY82351.1 Copper transporter MctB precursor [Corynebacterium cystitidis DSM 20524]SER52650.1 Copper transport outer membrane protein, MctB [Corynebacterium cystitidis DSM 20524]SNV76283.1 secreted protein, putative channel protein [Corynebacterium cystitidis]
MAGKKTSRSGWLVTGLGFGVAAGVALGTLVLAPAMGDIGGTSVSTSASGHGDSKEPAEDAAGARQAEIAAAQADAADGLVQGVGEKAVAGTLDQRPVLMVVAANAKQADIDAVADLLSQAGAEDSGRITLTEKFGDQNEADELKSIIANTLPAGAQLSEDNLAPGLHAGQSLGSALLYDDAGAQPQATVEDRALVLQTLREAEFIDYEDGTILPAQAIVIVTGDEDATGGSSFSAGMLIDMVRGLESRGGKLVVSGRIHAAADQGVIGRIRADEELNQAVSTVDSVDRAFGRVATVLAVAEQFNGESGAYGAAASAEAASPALG